MPTTTTSARYQTEKQFFFPLLSDA